MFLKSWGFPRGNLGFNTKSWLNDLDVKWVPQSLRKPLFVPLYYNSSKPHEHIDENP